MFLDLVAVPFLRGDHDWKDFMKSPTAPSSNTGENTGESMLIASFSYLVCVCFSIFLIMILSRNIVFVGGTIQEFHYSTHGRDKRRDFSC